ncbi:hypothetical protein DYBT9623_01805 [Dyadobacter sp. CECT 9623]|uniref:Tetratricopeptide repeat protein n=1 Tax=Dyadobacter linearis TaxID=2823330 RepID=A0ABM8UNS2_9BACT|nr:hypothetical protein [Dyadobacter sp. CECT 9623]CAG5069070.1 hypothetical protein DYBT9623_01805 [Dyadobacter sp. CECT 9623]
MSIIYLPEIGTLLAAFMLIFQNIIALQQPGPAFKKIPKFNPMNIFNPLILLAAYCIGLVSLKLTVSDTTPSDTSENITMCGPAYTRQSGLDENGKFVGVLPGWGSYSFPVTTTVDSSQFYFDQGLNMYYSYHVRESVASFKEAARLDPQNAMAYWGQALAMGPYYNAAHSYQKPAEITEVLAKMNAAAASAGVKEQKLIKAMNTRYSDGPGDAERQKLNTAYAKSMKSLVAEHPEEKEFKVLYIDAVMLLHAWDFWNRDGLAKSWTPELVALCQKVLKESPKHPAALHYHIHLTEASRNPGVALGSAETLRDLLPGVAHMVHMASHEYERNGLYYKGVEVNNLADDNLLRYDMVAKNLGLNKHSPHYFAVQTYCALTGGMYKDALRYGQRARKSVAPAYETTYDQYLFMLPVMVNVRMGKWEQILNDTVKLDPKWTYAGILSNFAKGVALVNTGKTELAAQELNSLREKINDPILTKRRIPFNSPVEMARIAEKILTGVISYAQKDQAKAIASLQAAVKLEDNLIYTEPKDWPIPSRQFLGNILIKSGQTALADQVYKADLVKNPGNGWSLMGLYQSAKAQGKTQLAAKYTGQYKAPFAHADELPAGSVFMK